MASESLPILPARFKVRVNNKTPEQFTCQGFDADPAVTEVVNACDAEGGELIFAYLYGLSGCKKPVLRLWIPPLPTSDRTGFNALRDGPTMKPLEDAREAGGRQMIVGMNATRATRSASG